MTKPDQASASHAWAARDIAALVICTLAWGTTWYAITLQLGVVDPVVSIVYRFALAAAVLFAWCAVRGEGVQISRRQHGFVALNGLFTFAINYPLVYWAEERVSSAVVAVLFAALAFGNLIGFRIAFGQRAGPLAWIAAALGIAGVCVLSWEEVTGAGIDTRALIGIGLTLLAVAVAVFGNIYARRAELAGVSVAAATAWSMAYGAAILAAFAVATGRAWTYEPTWSYTLSLLHLAIVGSVIAFLLYYALARSRGYVAASYISALTPPLAMLISTLLEDKSWGVLALAGVALVLGGQVLLMQTRRA